MRNKSECQIKSPGMFVVRLHSPHLNVVFLWLRLKLITAKQTYNLCSTLGSPDPAAYFAIVESGS